MRSEVRQVVRMCHARSRLRRRVVRQMTDIHYRMGTTYIDTDVRSRCSTCHFSIWQLYHDGQLSQS